MSTHTTGLSYLKHHNVLQLMMLILAWGLFAGSSGFMGLNKVFAADAPAGTAQETPSQIPDDDSSDVLDTIIIGDLSSEDDADADADADSAIEEAFEEGAEEDFKTEDEAEFAEDDEFDSEFDSDFGFDEDWDAAFDEPESGEAPSSVFTWRLDSAFENIIQTERDLHFEDASKKNEFSVLLECQYGNADDYLFSQTGFYFSPTFINDSIGEAYVYAGESETFRNLRISSNASEVIFRELYYNWSRKKFRLRMGNQVIAWGTADFLNSTSYFNPSDLRELLFKDEDQVTFGVPAVSGLFFLKGFTVETVFVPVHTAAAYPETGNFWAVKTVEGDYPLIFGDADPMDANSKNFGYGARLASTYKGIDFSVSGYHGPDKDAVLLPSGTVLIENQTVSLLVEPQHFVVDCLGFDSAFTYKDFVFQVEAVYSPNKSGFVIQDTSRPQDLEFPYDTRKTDFLSYSVGFNYFIPMQKFLPGHAGESLFTVEWYQAQYFDDDIEDPQITDFLTCRFQDTYFGDRLSVSMTGIFEIRNSGVILWPQIGYDFLNGFKVEVGYASIDGHGEGEYQKDSLFYYYKDNDFIMVNFRYAFP